eukprot:1168901-Rhodomonas_salina.1
MAAEQCHSWGSGGKALACGNGALECGNGALRLVGTGLCLRSLSALTRTTHQSGALCFFVSFRTLSFFVVCLLSFRLVPFGCRADAGGDHEVARGAPALRPRVPAARDPERHGRAPHPLNSKYILLSPMALAHVLLAGLRARCACFREGFGCAWLLHALDRAPEPLNSKHIFRFPVTVGLCLGFW